MADNSSDLVSRTVSSTSFRFKLIINANSATVWQNRFEDQYAAYQLQTNENGMKKTVESKL